MKTILLAEDRQINVMLMQAMIAEVLPDSELVVAENGKIAVEKWETLNPDIILMDMNMPELNGIEATKFIREKESGSDSHTPILALTAATDSDEVNSYKEAGMDDFIAKPVLLDDLNEKLKTYLSI